MKIPKNTLARHLACAVAAILWTVGASLASYQREAERHIGLVDQAPKRSVRKSPFRFANSIGSIVIVALALRLIAVLFLYQEQLSPDRDYFGFGWETGRVARSLALGQGFSSPLFGETGPTAFVTPVYAYLLAGVFKVFGIYSVQSALVILSINSLCSALTCIPIFFIAQKSFGPVVARRAGWAWALFPYGIAFAATRVWGDCLNALLLSLMVLMALHLAKSIAPTLWIGFGLLSGLAALGNPVVFSVLPALVGWAGYRLRQLQMKSGLPAALALLACMVVVAPWTVRNYMTFGQWMPVRDNFWMEIYIGNTGDTSDVVPDWTHPSTNSSEMEKFQRLGELGYIAEKRHLTLDFIAHHPATFVWLSLRRFGYVWTGFWSFSAGYLAVEPFEIPNMLFCTTLTALTLAGLRKAWCRRKAAAIPYALVLLCFPAVYYVTHPTMDYRHPIDPLNIVLAARAIAGQEKISRVRLIT
jgi:Dolichyl-phosphate-mannose-protein mannosyltransferase